MINTFWNICSTCPMPKEEKLNSEYKRNYVWHPIYRAVPQEVVCVPPQAAGAKELGIQRKKQYPDLAYRTSEVIGTGSGTSTVHFKDVVDRTRSEERDYGFGSKSGTRSRSAEPGMNRQQPSSVMAQSYPPQTSDQGALLPKIGELPSLAEGVQKNTEYRSQYAWPRHSGGKICTARKSISMGLIRAPDQPDSSVVSKPRDTLGVYHRLPTQEENPNATQETAMQDLKKKVKTEYKAKYKPFTSYVYIDGQWKKTSRLIKVPEENTSVVRCHPWYSEVMERLQKANEYKCRGHGHQYGEQATVVHSKRGETTPVVQLKKDVPEVHIPPTLSEKKKERQKRPDRKQLPEKKGETESKPEKSRPKSADPGRSRKPRPQQRPRTAPPPAKDPSSAPAPAHLAYAKKSTSKGPSTEGRTKSMSRPPSSRKGLPSDGRASRTSHHQQHPTSAASSSSGKVWLQSGTQAAPSPAPEDTAGESGFKGKHSDAVRPSTLLPPKPKLPPPVDDQGSTTFQPIKPSTELPASVKVNPSPVPLTHVQTPEEVTGVKSPEPENWTVPLDKGKKLQWTDSSAHETLLTQSKPASPKPETSEKDDNKASSAKSDVPASADSGVQRPANPSPSKMTTADVLDRARSRLDQFWGKK